MTVSILILLLTILSGCTAPINLVKTMEPSCNGETIKIKGRALDPMLFSKIKPLENTAFFKVDTRSHKNWYEYEEEYSATDTFRRGRFIYFTFESEDLSIGNHYRACMKYNIPGSPMGVETIVVGSDIVIS